MSATGSDPFSLAQLLGYAAFVVGITAFWQRDDRRLRYFVVALSLTYVVHFSLLGNPAAAAGAGISAVRSWLSIFTRSPWVAAAVVAANIGFGAAVVTHWQQLLPLAGSVVGTLAMFFLDGIALRVTLLFGTSLWLTNNILSGSIGGAALETVIGLTNAVTIVRMTIARRRMQTAGEPPQPGGRVSG
ncbi:MAG TPA: YgjV family protein [Aromatoleum sp.]|uniref:YgjV family protein n=1 Tax=Aromatoleum sp. TaxID=2307007 RepID=UPI002B4A860D|nr:YgjV family protein [Aromatoleum sp.]HJV25154.1 YgjV family protein [Aromatoleum sp.]